MLSLEQRVARGLAVFPALASVRHAHQEVEWYSPPPRGKRPPPAPTRRERLQGLIAQLGLLEAREGERADDTYPIGETRGSDVVAGMDSALTCLKSLTPAAGLVNIVYLSRLRQTPLNLPAVSLAALWQHLLGIASFGVKKNGNIEATFNVRGPFRAKLSFTPSDMRLEEAAATSASRGERVLGLVLALMGSALGLQSPTQALVPFERRRTNEVYGPSANLWLLPIIRIPQVHDLLALPH